MPQRDKLTKQKPKYPKGLEPDFMLPETYCDYRYLLGKQGNHPFVALCMNPSVAREEHSDMTVNRIISMGQKLGYDGWAIINMYPERATDASQLESFKEDLTKENCQSIVNYLKEHHITEVFGAWGDLKGSILPQARDMLLQAFGDANIRVFYFPHENTERPSLTKAGNPPHPINRSIKRDLSRKEYLDYKNLIGS